MLVGYIKIIHNLNKPTNERDKMTNIQTVVHLVYNSKNVKTGDIPQTYSTKSYCPDTCPLKLNGCYAEDFFTNQTWTKVTDGRLGKTWDDFTVQIQELKPNTLWRHNVGGDLPHTNGLLDGEMINQLSKANTGKRGYTYTHHLPLLGDNLAILKQANNEGFTVNASANNDKEAMHYFSLGLPTVVITNKTKNHKLADGTNVVICPAQVSDDVNCKTCAYCAKSDRKAIVGFIAHGTRSKKVIAIASV